MTWQKITQRGFLVAVIGVAVFGLSGCLKQQEITYSTSLEVWGVFDDSADYGKIFKDYAQMHPFVESVTYRKFPAEEYEKELIDALAAGNGPDVFMVHNSWVPDYLNKIAPANTGFVDQVALERAFVDAVKDDFLIDGQVYGLPLSVDSLALYYNKDIFNAHNIIQPPQTWEEFTDVVEKTTEVDQYGNITEIGATFGTGRNINRSADLITLLLFQSGVVMTEGNAASFTRYTQSGAQSVNAGERALSFYTQFAMPSRTMYTWNRRQHYSIDAFIEGNVAMMLNYSWQYNTIARKNEKLRFGVAPVPQLTDDRKYNVANYWSFVVSQNKTPQSTGDGRKPITNAMRIHESWQFVKYLTMATGRSFPLVHAVTFETRSKPLTLDPAQDYLLRTQKPAARKDLIQEQLSDPALGVFAEGNIHARSWSRKNPEEVENVIVNMIESVNVGQESVSEALRTAESRVTQLLR